MSKEEFYITWKSGDFEETPQTTQPDREKDVFLWFILNTQTIKINYTENTTQIIKLNVERRVNSIIRTGYVHPDHGRIGQNFKFEETIETDFIKDPTIIATGVLTPQQWLEAREARAKRNRGTLVKKLKFLNINDIEVNVYNHLIEVLDANNMSILALKEIEEDIFFAEQILPDKIKVTLRDETLKTFKIEFFEKSYQVHTNSMTLNSIYYNLASNKGYYFGAFEFGSFSLEVENGTYKISLDRPIPLMHAISGQVDDKDAFVGFQNGVIQRFMGLTQEMQWEAQARGSVLCMEVWDNNLFSGQMDGSVKKFDKDTGSLIKTWTIAEMGITSLLEIEEDLIVVGTEDGFLICMDILREEKKWDIKLETGKVMAINILSKNDEESLIFAITKKGEIVQVDYKTGKITNAKKFDQKFSSNQIQVGNWQIIGIENNLLLINEDQEKHIPMEKASIRSLCQYSEGIIVGSITGELTLWKRIGLKEA